MIEQVIVALLGLSVGSFITLASWRMPRGESIVLPPSRCPACTKTLGVRDLVPVLSWLCARGKCRHCGIKIHWRYPALELATVTAFLFIYAQYGFAPQALALALMATLLLIMIAVDFEHYIIPDTINIGLFLLGVAYGLLIGTSWQQMLTGTLLGLTLGLALRYGYYFLRKREGLGLGDVKFFAAAGVWLGLEPFVAFLFFSGAFGVATALAWRALGQGERFPFGPALAAALFLCVAWPDAPMLFWQWQGALWR